MKYLLETRHYLFIGLIFISLINIIMKGKSQVYRVAVLLLFLFAIGLSFNFVVQQLKKYIIKEYELKHPLEKCDS